MVGYTNVYWHLFFNISQKIFYIQAKHLKIFSWNNFMCKPNKGNHFSVYFLEHSQTRKKKNSKKCFHLKIFLYLENILRWTKHNLSLTWAILGRSWTLKGLLLFLFFFLRGTKRTWDLFGIVVYTTVFYV